MSAQHADVHTGLPVHAVGGQTGPDHHGLPGGTIPPGAVVPASNSSSSRNGTVKAPKCTLTKTPHRLLHPNIIATSEPTHIQQQQRRLTWCGWRETYWWQRSWGWGTRCSRRHARGRHSCWWRYAGYCWWDTWDTWGSHSSGGWCYTWDPWWQAWHRGDTSWCYTGNGGCAWCANDGRY